MHELSIAQAIVDIASRNARGSRVTRVHVRVGHLRQVVPSALEFSFELCAHGTAVEDAALELEVVPIDVTLPPLRGRAASRAGSRWPARRAEG